MRSSKQPGRKAISLHPASFEDALKALLSTPPPDSEKKNQPKKPAK